MAKPYTQPKTTKRSTQGMDNLGFDPDFNVRTTHQIEFDGTDLKRGQTGLLAKKIVDDLAGNVYVCASPTGTAEATAKWQIKKINDDGSGTVVITWADGNSSFDNVATNPAGLSYS